MWLWAWTVQLALSGTGAGSRIILRVIILQTRCNTQRHFYLYDCLGSLCAPYSCTLGEV